MDIACKYGHTEQLWTYVIDLKHKIKFYLNDGFVTCRLKQEAVFSLFGFQENYILDEIKVLNEKSIVGHFLLTEENLNNLIMCFATL